MNGEPRRLAGVSCAFYLLIVIGLCIWTAKLNHGSFGYALDDPYIHLALAQNIAHGHYGINPGEYSSPSSSILWPFLLAPFANTGLSRFVPLVFNALFGSAAAALIGFYVGRWLSGLTGRSRFSQALGSVLAILLIFVGNLGTLTIIGMEHSLEVLVAVCCAIGLAYAVEGLPIPTWILVVSVVGPTVRYECFALVAALALALAGRRQWQLAFGIVGFSLLPVLAFSLFLHHLGLPMMPVSVLVKSSAYEGRQPLIDFAKLFSNFTRIERMPLCAATGLLGISAWFESRREVRFALMGAALLGLLQMLVGPFNWFHRYEPYSAIFTVMVLLAYAALRPRPVPFAYVFFGLLFCSVNYVKATAAAPFAAHDIYDQQYQMHRFVTRFYTGNYAVNDIGWVSYDRRPGSYVLDVLGLASVESARQKNKTPEWLAGMIARHNAPLAMVYPSWYQAPPSWTAEARLCVDRQSRDVVLGQPCVLFYSTTPAATKPLHEELAAFGKTVPADDTFTLLSPTASPPAESPLPAAQDNRPDQP